MKPRRTDVQETNDLERPVIVCLTHDKGSTVEALTLEEAMALREQLGEVLAGVLRARGRVRASLH